MFFFGKKKLLILVAVFIALMTTGVGCKGGSRDAQKALNKKVVIDMWGVFDGSGAFDGIVSAYRRSRPNVEIKYRKLRFAEYEDALLNAWAEGRGPDIIMVHNTWVGGYGNKISPLPKTLQIAKRTPSNVATFDASRTITPDGVKDRFVPVVYKDAVVGDKIYALPLSVDTLALYYNRKMFDQSGVFSVPKTWREVVEVSKKITKYDDNGSVVRSGIALGGSENINRSFDIVSLLMAQNGTKFVDASGRRAVFARRSPLLADSSFLPGVEALRFYTDFANPAKETYTWDESFESAQQRFASGKLGMMLGYSYQIPYLKAQGPKIDFGVAPLPHINPDGIDATGETVNWANYWMLAVAKSSDNKEQSWDFIQYVTTNPEIAKLYLDYTQKPTALRALVAEQASQSVRGIFAKQLLTARSWYRGKYVSVAEQVFSEMIKEVVEGRGTANSAIKRAESVITPTL